MKTIVLGLTSLLAFNAYAAAQENPKQYELTKPPQCTNDKGEQVEFRERNGGRFQVAAGMANRDAEGKPFVLRVNYAFSPPEFQRFIDYHECAHHQTGDVDRPHPPRNGPEHLLNESISDCVSILRLRDDENYDVKKLNAVTTAMRADMAKIGFPEISISSRISNLENCYKRDGTPADYIEVIKTRRAQNQ